jgi:hypothetical protein
MIGRIRLALGIVAVGLLISAAAADDKKAADSATGTWESTFKTNDGQTFKTIYKLKQDGEKLTGTVTGRDGKETKLDKGEVKDGKVSFQVTREFNDQKFTIRYKGELKGDSIKGKLEFVQGDNSREFDWEAKRQKAEK